MPETFEERLTPRLDGLYAGALFLAGGDEPAAEGLLVEAVRQAFRVFRRARPAGDPDAWFDARLVDAFRRTSGDTPDPAGPATLEERRGVGDFDRRAVAASTRSGVGRAGRVGEEVDWSAVADAAAGIPPLPRAAVWLVVLRRWSYAEVARVLEIDPTDLPDLLSYRGLLSVPGRGKAPRWSASGSNGSGT